MFHPRTLNNKINRLREKVLRIVYGDCNSKLDKPLDKDSFFSINHRNIQTFKYSNSNIQIFSSIQFGQMVECSFTN